MDSMRHLSTSLPTAAGRRRREPPQQLLGSFKEAALSVTNLYKAAASAQGKARAAGYQDALDDLLAFLDSENLGLMDGEGWRVRQWATERLDDDSVQRQSAGSEDEDEGGMTATRSSSPEVQRKPAAVPTVAPIIETETNESELGSRQPEPEQTIPTQPQEQPIPSPAPTQTGPLAPANYDFTFRSQDAYPTNHDRDGNGTMELDSGASSSPNGTETLRLHSRPNRHRHPNRQRTGGSTFNFNLGPGVGNKRKAPLPDFFDISGFSFDGSDRRDGGGRGGKRGRHI